MAASPNGRLSSVFMEKLVVQSLHDFQSAKGTVIATWRISIFSIWWSGCQLLYWLLRCSLLITVCVYPALGEGD